MKVFKELIKSLTVRPYYKIRGMWAVWNFFNARARKLQRANPLPTDSLGKRIVNEMKENGIAITHLEDLFLGEKWLTEFQTYAKERSKDAKIVEKKDFFKDLWDSNNSYITQENPLVRFALSDRIVSIANEYMEMYSELHAFRGMETVLVPKNVLPRQSQQWHRDPDDKKLCKVFIYINDVDEGTGPFCYVSGTQPKGRWNHIYGPKTPYSWRPSDRPQEGEFKKVIPQKDIVCYPARAGTVIFADTTGIHKGGYSTEKSRIMFLAAFKSRHSFTRRKKYRYPAGFKKEITQLSPQARYAVRQE